MSFKTVDTSIVEEVIKRHGLNKKNRKRSYVYRRYALCHFLRKNGFTFERIGSMINKDHATVCHYVKRFDMLIKYEDFSIVNSLMENELSKSIVLIDPVTKNNIALTELEIELMLCRTKNDFVKLQQTVIKTTLI